MLASNSAGSDPAGPHAAGWRPYALALLPLALAGALPWWATALLCLLYGLSVRYEVWQQGRALIGLLIVGLTVVAAFPELKAGPHQQIWQLLENLQWQYLARLLMIGLLAWAASDLQDGERRGLWLVLLAGLLAPQPLLVVALAAGALALPGLDDRRASAAKWQEPEAPGNSANGFWMMPLMFVALFSVLALALPRYSPQVAPRESSSPGAAASAHPTPAHPAAQPANQGGLAGVSKAASQMVGPPGALPALKLPDADLPVGLALVLGVLLLAYLFGRQRAKSGRITLPEILMSLALLLTLALLFIFGAMTGRGGSGGGLPEAEQALNAKAHGGGTGTITHESGPAALVWLVYWVLLVGQVALIGLMVWLLLRRLWPHLSAPAQPAPLPPHLADATPEQLALHRVRVAYRQASEALGSRGWGRGVAETPLGYAARLGAQFPVLAGPMTTLTAAYDPVRYGGKVTEDEADSAEAAALAVQNHAAQLPPPAEKLPADPLPEPSLTLQENP